MARDNDSPASGSTGRDRYRDNDDVRQIDDPGTRNDRKSDSRNEARGDARESIGNHARGTDANPTGPSGNDRQKSRSDLPDPISGGRLLQGLAERRDSRQ